MVASAGTVKPRGLSPADRLSEELHSFSPSSAQSPSSLKSIHPSSLPASEMR